MNDEDREPAGRLFGPVEWSIDDRRVTWEEFESEFRKDTGLKGDVSLTEKDAW